MTSSLPLSAYRTGHRQKGFITHTGLIVLAFASAFFPRILEAIGAPALINFVHFAIVPGVCLLIFLRSRGGSYQQRSIMRSILAGLYAYFAVSAVSAFINGAGAINIFLNFMIQSEPFLILAAIIVLPITPQQTQRFRYWILAFGLIHLILSYGQYVGLELGILPHEILTLEDNIQGVFYLSWGGHVVGGTVAFVYGIYYFISARTGLMLRLAVLAISILQVLLCDAKQVILVGAIAWVVLIISNSTDIKKTLKYGILATLVLSSFYWAVYNIDIPYLSAFHTWIRPEIYGPEGDATVQKLLPLRAIPEYFTSSANWFLGLGPGHTVGRIGGWMIRDYAPLLNPLGATTHPVVQAMWDYWNSSYLDSSMFSPFWGWAGIWGDVGFVGLGVYLALWGLLWRKVCLDDLSRFLLLNVLINGFIFTSMEEPGVMLTIAVLLGLRWHEINPRPIRPAQQSFGGPNLYLT
jgi:hypothetical protein